MKSAHRQPQANVSPLRAVALAAAMTATVLAAAALSGGGGAAAAHQTDRPPSEAEQPRQEPHQPETDRTPTATAGATPSATLTATPSGTRTPTTGATPSATARSTGAARQPTTRTYGVPAGTRLKPSGDVVVRKAGTVIDGLDVRGCITVLAPSVVIKNSRVSGSCDNLISNRSTGLLVEDVELDGGGDPSVQGIGWGGFTARRLDIHGVGDGVRANGDVVLESSYIHDLVTADGFHNDGVQVTEGSNIVIRDNVIENPFTQTSAILLGAHQGSVSNVLVVGNLLAGGGYTLYGGADPRSNYTISNIVLRDNVFSTKFYPKSGRYGPMTATDDPSIQVSGNIWEGTGQAVS